MGLFLDYTSNLFAGLNKTPTTILQTGTSLIPHVIVVNGINICNLTAQPIRFNLQKERTTTASTDIFYIKNLEIAASGSIDVIKQFGLQIYLYYTQTPLLTDKLICFSNTVAQTFDCEITYSILNETPITS